MATTKQIDAMTAATALGGTEELPGVQSAANVKITAAQIKTFVSASPTLVTPVLGVASGTSLALAAGSSATAALQVGAANTGLFASSPTILDAVAGGVVSARLSSNGWFLPVSAGTAQLSSGGALQFSSGAAGSSAADTGLSRISAGVIGVGTGTQGATDGTIRAANLNLRDNYAQITFGSSYDLILTRPAAATLQHGAADAASPVAQTIKFQDVVAGTSNTAGVNATIQAPAGTGTGAGGSLIFQVAPAGSTGTAKNAQETALTIASDKSVTGAASVVAGTFLKSGSYTVATVPSASSAGAGARIYVSDETGGATPAFSDGTNWRRYSDRAIIS